MIVRSSNVLIFFFSNVPTFFLPNTPKSTQKGFRYYREVTVTICRVLSSGSSCCIGVPGKSSWREHKDFTGGTFLELIKNERVKWKFVQTKWSWFFSWNGFTDNTELSDGWPVVRFWGVLQFVLENRKFDYWIFIKKISSTRTVISPFCLSDGSSSWISKLDPSINVFTTFLTFRFTPTTLVVLKPFLHFGDGGELIFLFLFFRPDSGVPSPSVTSSWKLRPPSHPLTDRIGERMRDFFVEGNVSETPSVYHYMKRPNSADLLFSRSFPTLTQTLICLFTGRVGKSCRHSESTLLF